MKENTRTQIEDLEPEAISDEELLLVAGGEPNHDCTSGSGANCAADDCSGWSGGNSHCS